MATHIDPHSIVSPRAELGENVCVGPFAVVEDNVIIGDGTSIGAHAVVASGARIGKECKIHSGAVIGTVPQDLKFHGEETTLEIGDRTVVREFATLNRGTEDRWKTIIGSNCLLMAYVHVAHDCILGERVILANAVNMGGHVTIEEYVIVGGMTPIHQFVTIGRHVMVGGGFRVPKDVPPYVLAAQEPLSFGGLNIVGLKRRNFSRQAIDSLEKAYGFLYHSNLNVSQAVVKIKNEVPMTPEVQHVIEFVENSKRGIIGARRRD
ncbi:MAG: acyl-ACP--UDP-N-acetylglucosamine O-acyltransferase [Bacteroidota bacterium]